MREFAHDEFLKKAFESDQIVEFFFVLGNFLLKQKIKEKQILSRLCL